MAEHVEAVRVTLRFALACTMLAVVVLSLGVVALGLSASHDHARLRLLQRELRFLACITAHGPHGESSITAVRSPDGKLHVSSAAVTGCVR